MRPTLRCLFCRGRVLQEKGLERYKDHLAQEHNIEYFIDWVVEKTMDESANSVPSQFGESSIVVSKCEDVKDDKTLVENDNHRQSEFGESSIVISKYEDVKENELSLNELSLDSEPKGANVNHLTVPSPREKVICGARSPLSSVRRNKISPSAKRVKIGGKKLTFNVNVGGNVGQEHLLEARQKMKKTRSKRMSIVAFQTNYKRPPIALPSNRRMSILSPARSTQATVKSSRERKCSFEECDLTFESMIELRKHKASHPKKTFKCEECGEEFDYKNFLEKHRRICQLP